MRVPNTWVNLIAYIVDPLESPLFEVRDLLLPRPKLLFGFFSIFGLLPNLSWCIFIEFAVPLMEGTVVLIGYAVEGNTDEVEQFIECAESVSIVERRCSQTPDARMHSGDHNVDI